MRSERGQSRRREALLVPSERSRLWIGLGIAVLGPLAITPVVRTDPFSVLPGVPYLLVVVLATVFGRMLAAGVATVLSMVLVDRYFIDGSSTFAVQTTRGVVPLAILMVVAVLVAQLVVRLDRVVGARAADLDRLAFLATAGDAMSGALDVDETLRRLGEVLVPELADWFAVDLLDDSGTIRTALVLHPDPAKVETARELQRRFPRDPDAPSGVPHVIRTGRSQLTERISEDLLRTLVPNPELREAVRSLGLRCAMIVPLTARGRTFGALSLVGAETHDRYGPEDLRLAEEIADRVALAIDTAALFAAETAAREAATAEARRNEVLKDVTAAFGRAATVGEVLGVMLEDGLQPAGAVRGTVGLLADGRIELIAISGYDPDDRPYWRSFGVDEQLPMSEAIRERRPVVLTTIAERDRRYPSIAGTGDPRDHALVCLPLLLGDEPIGGFSASYPPETAFGDDDLTFLRALGEQCAQAIDRARSVEREAATRARFNALGRGSRALAQTLDLDETAATVVGIAVEHFGSSAALYALERGGPTRLAAAGPAAALPRAHEGEPELPIAAAIHRAAERQAAQLLDPSDGPPALILPLGIAGRVSDALVVVEPSRDFRQPDELEFAQELARRMARALENARLYRERDYVARTLQRSLLPPGLPDVPGLEIEALFRPAVRSHEVGGDFYDVFTTASGRWAAVIGDVCGKGVEAATLTGMARHTLRAISDVGRPSDALAALNRALLRERLDGRFITVAYVLIEERSTAGIRLQIASGGHPLPQHLSPDGAVERVGRHGTLLGVTPDPRLADTGLLLQPGALLVLFTDGLLKKDEAVADVPARLVASLAESPVLSAIEARSRIERYVDEAGAEGQDDDVAVLVLRAR